MDLTSELTSRAETFNSFWERYLPNGDPQTLYDAARHLPHGGGKRLRPVLSMLTCESVGGDMKQVLPFAAALELMHNFTLVHDDIMDKSTLRRNLPTVHIEYSEPTAILAGDFLFARSFEAMHELKIDLATFKTLERGLIDCILDICIGQQLDIEFEKRKIVTEKEYISMITKKTAVLFQLASRGGVIIGGGTEEKIKALTTYGLSLGLGFQIWDDYLDLQSDEDTLGKDIGNDIRNGKKTLIAVHALNHAESDQQQLLETIFGNSGATEEDIKRIFTLFKEVGAVEYAQTKALSYIQEAQQSLSVLKDTAAKEILQNLADYAIQREK